VVAHLTLAENMKATLVRLMTLGACLSQSACFSAMLNIGGATSGEKVEPHERVIAGAADVVTAPIQVPLLLAMDPPTLAGKRIPQQTGEEKNARRDSQ